LRPQQLTGENDVARTHWRRGGERHVTKSVDGVPTDHWDAASAIKDGIKIPLRRQPLPRAPNPITALVRSLESRREDFKRQLKQSDVLLTPPLPSAMGILDWHRHTELKEAAHSWAKDEIGRLQAEAHPALATTASDHLDLRALA